MLSTSSYAYIPRMKKLISLVLVGTLLLALNAPHANAENCRIAGVWKSNEELTLKNMEKAQLTEKQRKLFSNNFFGKLVLNYTCKGFTSTFEGKIDTYEFLSMSESGDTVTTEYYDPFYKQNMKRTAVISGNCYSIALEHLGFDEVFCRIK